MFTRNIPIKTAITRLNDINYRAFENGYYLYQLAEIANGSLVRSYTSTFSGDPGHPSFSDRLTTERKAIEEFGVRFGPKGINTLMVFEGSLLRDPLRIWKRIAETIEYEVLDLDVLDDEAGMFDASFREHLYFLGFPDRTNQQLFTMTYAGQDFSDETE